MKDGKLPVVKEGANSVIRTVDPSVAHIVIACSRCIHLAFIRTSHVIRSRKLVIRWQAFAIADYENSGNAICFV